MYKQAVMLCWPYCHLIKYLPLYVMADAPAATLASRPVPPHPRRALALLAWILLPKISLPGENVCLWSSPERQIPLRLAVCCTSASSSLCVNVSVCSTSLLPPLCSKYSSFNEVKFFNYYFSLWNGSRSLGFLIVSDWKGEKKSFKQFSDSL